MVALVIVGCGGPPPPKTSAKTLEPLRRTVDVQGRVNATVSYLANGDAGGARLILVHGTPGAASIWADYVAEPPAGVEVVALDRPGFGRSGPDDALVSLGAQADAVAALLAPDRPNILLGHSLGGPIVAWVAAEHPDRVAALVMLAASMDPGLEDLHFLQPVGASFVFRWMLPRILRNANDELIALKPELEALEAMLPRVTAPVLIIHGTEDDLVPYANVPFMQQKMTGACRLETITLDGADHFLPERAASTIWDGVQRILGAATACSTGG